MRLADLVRLVRAPAALSVPGDAIAGAAAAGRLGPRTIGLAGAAVCLYWAGMAANDWADRAIDATERPDRPIPSGQVSPRAAAGIAAGLTVAGLGLAAAGAGRRALRVAVPLAGAVWAYDVAAKDTAAAPVVMAACRALDVLLGASGGPLRKAVPAALTVGAHTVTVTALSRREVHGGRPGLAAATLAATAGIAASVVAPRPRPAGPKASRTGSRERSPRCALVLAGLYALRFAAPQLRVLDDPGAARIRAAVAAGIVELPMLQGALTGRAGRPWTGLAVAAAAPLGRMLARQVSPT